MNRTGGDRWLHADSDRDGCLASASQRRRAHPDLAGAQRRKARRHHRIPVARGISLGAAADLSGTAAGAAEPKQDRAAHRAGQARRDSHRDRRHRSAIMARAYCRSHGRPFTTSYTTRFPEYISARWPIPERWIYAALRRFHGAAAVTMVATPSLTAELTERGFNNIGMWTRGVDTDLFSPDRAIDARSAAADLPQRRTGRGREESRSVPVARSAGHQGGDRDGPAGGRAAAAVSRREIPRACSRTASFAAHLAAADVFVFPSRTDTFGVVQLEALACGVPVAAFPVTGPKDVIADNPVGALNEDLRAGLPRRAENVARRPAATSRWRTPGRTAPGNSSATSNVSCRATPAGLRCNRPSRQRAQRLKRSEADVEHKKGQAGS